jgi:hypothetical protein
VTPFTLTCPENRFDEISRSREELRYQSWVVLTVIVINRVDARSSKPVELLEPSPEETQTQAIRLRK